MSLTKREKPFLCDQQVVGVLEAGNLSGYVFLVLGRTGLALFAGTAGSWRVALSVRAASAAFLFLVGVEFAEACPPSCWLLTASTCALHFSAKAWRTPASISGSKSLLQIVAWWKHGVKS